MEITRRIEELIAPSLESLGYETVRTRLTGSQTKTLQVMIERSDREQLTVDDCANASTAISALLDVEDTISGHYTLEVSSPGIDRPLTRLDDFDRFSGFETKIEMQHPVDGRSRFRGSLLGVDGDNVLIVVNGDKASLPFPLIKSAKLVLTDELIEAAQLERRV